MSVSAPGKAFLCGEYAVTEGAPAIVAAVDRRVSAGFGNARSDGYPLGPEATVTLELAKRAFGPTPSLVALDRHALFEGETKLGLGSSAAGAVAVAGAVAAYHGHDPSSRETRRRVFDVALTGHARVAPDGSGADVASAAYGGFVRFQRSKQQGISIEPRSAPETLALSLVWTGTAVRTSDLLRRIKRLGASNPSAYERAMAALRGLSEEFAAAFRAREVRHLIVTVKHYHEAMATLGRAADVPIVDASLAEIARAAEEEGGAAKPCGAGGGDVAIAFFDDPSARKRFEVRCKANGSTPLALTWGAPGIELVFGLRARRSSDAHQDSQRSRYPDCGCSRAAHLRR